MITVGQLKEWIAEQLHENETDTVLSRVLIPRWVTQARDRVVGYTTWRWNEDQMQLTWPTAGDDASILYLPEYIDRIKTLRPDRASGSSSVRMVTATEMDRWTSDTGRDRLVLHGWYGVENDMPAAGVITATSVGGTVNQTALLEGLDVNDRLQREEVLVPFGGAVVGASTFKAGVGGIKRISLIGDGTGTPIRTTGVITFTSGGTTLERLDSAWEIGHEHRRTELRATVGGISEYTCRYWRKHFPLTRDQDVVDIPEYFHDVMELGVAIKLAQFRGVDAEVMMLSNNWNQRMVELLAYDKREPGRKYKVRVRPQWGGRRFQ